MKSIIRASFCLPKKLPRSARSCRKLVPSSRAVLHLQWLDGTLWRKSYCLLRARRSALSTQFSRVRGKTNADGRYCPNRNARGLGRDGPPRRIFLWPNRQQQSTTRSASHPSHLKSSPQTLHHSCHLGTGCSIPQSAVLGREGRTSCARSLSTSDRENRLAYPATSHRSSLE